MTLNIASEEPLITITKNQSRTTSLKIATSFQKEHKNVLRDIKNLKQKGCPNEFNRLNFEPVEYRDSKGEKRPMYEITRDGFVILAMGFTGKEAMLWKIKFIQAFNEMERHLILKNREEIEVKTGEQFDLVVKRFEMAIKAAKLVGLEDEEKAKRIANQITLDTTGVNLTNFFVGFSKEKGEKDLEEKEQIQLLVNLIEKWWEKYQNQIINLNQICEMISKENIGKLGKQKNVQKKKLNELLLKCHKNKSEEYKILSLGGYKSQELWKLERNKNV